MRADTPRPVSQPTAYYAHWAATVASNDWPDTALVKARQCFRDAIGCMVAGAGQPSVIVARAYAGQSAAGPAQLVGSPDRTTPELAGLVNGTAAHALDFDDNHSPSRTHASAALFPALLALGAAERKTSADVLDAFIVAIEVLTRIGHALNPIHKNLGWQGTSTIGVLGVAVAAARLLKLDPVQTRNALSIATSLSGGMTLQHGTLTKSMAAGFAAQNGLQAARLAAVGCTAAPEILAGNIGYRRLMTSADIDQLAEAGFEGSYGESLTFRPVYEGGRLAIDEFGLMLKRFPNCSSAHRSMDVVLALRQMRNLQPDNVAQIKIRLPAAQYMNLMYPRPKTGNEALFSLQYGVSVILLKGAFDFDDVSDAAAQRPDIQPLLERVHAEPVEDPTLRMPTEVTLKLTDGTVLQEQISVPRGNVKNPLSEEELAAKFAYCLAYQAPDEVAGAIQDWFVQEDAPAELVVLDGLMNFAPKR